MKTKNLIILALFALSFFAISCDNDDDQHVVYYNDILTVVPNDASGYLLRQDDGTILKPSNDKLAETKNSRAFVTYVPSTQVVDNPSNYSVVDVYALNYILTKPTLDLDEMNADSIGNDPARIVDMWVGDDYLNVYFSYDANGYTVHFINLVNNTTLPAATDGKVHLEFRHNANGDYPARRVFGMAAFDLRPYQVAGQDSVQFVIKVNEYDGEREYEVNYNYLPSVSPAEHLMPSPVEVINTIE